MEMPESIAANVKLLILMFIEHLLRNTSEINTNWKKKNKIGKQKTK